MSRVRAFDDCGELRVADPRLLARRADGAWADAHLPYMVGSQYQGVMRREGQAGAQGRGGADTDP